MQSDFLLNIIHREMETHEHSLTSPTLDPSVCRRSWINSPRKYSPLFHYRHNKSKAVETQAFYFLTIPAYLSLLISPKGWQNTFASTGLIGGRLATLEAICNCTKWTQIMIVLLSSIVYPFRTAVNNYRMWKVFLSWPPLKWQIKASSVIESS